MAHLNVRERVIEAKVAYVGGALAGKRTNLRELEARRGAEGDAATEQDASTSPTLKVRVRHAPPSEDDDAMVVTLVAHRGEPAEDAVRSLLHEVDGVVVVVDAAPSARERNRGSIAAVRRALVDRLVPVVVQINKTDLAEAIPASELLHELDVHDWPHVEASARTGQGVEETLHQVVYDAMQSLTRSANDTEAPFEHLLSDENPLLTALKQVLEATVERHVARLAEELAARVERHLEAQFDAIRANVARLDAKVEAMAAAEERRLDAGMEALSARAEGRIDAKVGELAVAVERRLSAVAARVDAAESGTRAFRHQLVTSNDELLRASRHACTREDLATSAADLRDDLARALGAEREFSVSATSTLRARITALEEAVERAAEASSERIEPIEKMVAEMLGEMKKPKKGFFG